MEKKSKIDIETDLVSFDRNLWLSECVPLLIKPKKNVYFCDLFSIFIISRG